MSEFTPEEKAEIRAARWDGAKRAAKALPGVMKNTLKAGVPISLIAAKKSQNERKEALNHSLENMRTVRAGHEDALRGSHLNGALNTNGVYHHNQINIAKNYENRDRYRLANNTYKNNLKETAPFIMGTMAATPVFGIAAGAIIGGHIKKQEIRARRTKTIDKSASIVDMLKTARSKNVKRMVAKLSPESQRRYELHRNGHGFLDSIDAGYQAGNPIGTYRNRIRKIQDIKDRYPDFSRDEIRDRYNTDRVFRNMNNTFVGEYLNDPLVGDDADTRRQVFDENSRRGVDEAKKISLERKEGQREAQIISKDKDYSTHWDEPFLRDTPEWKKKQDEQKNKVSPEVHSQNKQIENKASFGIGAKVGAGALTVAGLYGAYKLKKYLDKNKEYKKMKKEAAIDLLSAARIAKNFRENNRKDASRVSIKTKNVASKPNLRKSISTDPIEMVGRSAHLNFLRHRNAGGNQDNAKNVAEYQLGAERDRDISKFGRPSASLHSSSLPSQIGSINRLHKRREISKKMKNSGSSEEDIDRMHDRLDKYDDAAIKRERAYNGSNSWIKNHSLTPLKKDHSSVIDITPRIEAKKEQEAARVESQATKIPVGNKAKRNNRLKITGSKPERAPEPEKKKRSIRYHRLTEEEQRARAVNDPQLAKEKNNAVFYEPKESGAPTPKSEQEIKKLDVKKLDVKKLDVKKPNLHTVESEPVKNTSPSATISKKGLSRNQKIGGGVVATAGALYLANRYRKARKAKREAEQLKTAGVLDNIQTSHNVNLGKETRDWIDAKSKKVGDSLRAGGQYVLNLKDKAAPHVTKRNAAIGAGAVATLMAAKGIKRHIKNKLDDRAAKKKEDDRINYYRGQMDTHKDNQYMLRSLASRMSKEKFDA